MDSLLIVALAVIAAGGAFLAFRFVINRRSDSSTKTIIKDVSTFGDVAGRDINKKDK